MAVTIKSHIHFYIILTMYGSYGFTEVHPPLFLLDYKQRCLPKSTAKIITVTVILQEFNLQADLSIVNAVMDIFPSQGGEEELMVNTANSILF